MVMTKAKFAMPRARGRQRSIRAYGRPQIATFRFSRSCSFSDVSFRSL